MALLIIVLITATASLILFKLALFAAIVAIGAKALIVPSQQLMPANIHADASRRLLVNRY